MGLKKHTTLPISRILVLLLLMMIDIARSDSFEQERSECANQLVSLATCIPYVGGQSKAPTVDCCGGLKQVLEKSKKCLCILIKDRDNPNLGIKINGTRAAELPNACNSGGNVTECIDILHLSPSSPDAKVFAGFANMTKGASAASAPVTSGNSTSSGSSAQVKNGVGGMERSWVGAETMTICGFLAWAFASFYV